MQNDVFGNSTGLGIDIFVLVGGSSKMPWIERMFKEALANGKPVVMTVSPDEAIALGAGLYAAKLGGLQKVPPDSRLFDIASLSYGIEVKGGEMSLIIQRNTPVSASPTRSYTTIVYALKCTKGTTGCVVEIKNCVNSIFLLNRLQKVFSRYALPGFSHATLCLPSQQKTWPAKKR